MFARGSCTEAEYTFGGPDPWKSTTPNGTFGTFFTEGWGEQAGTRPPSPLEDGRACAEHQRLVHAADWHERETEDLFGLCFEGHPRLGDFVLHEEWPEGVNPMRAASMRAAIHTERLDPEWRPQTIVQAPGAFMMPIGPVYSDRRVGPFSAGNGGRGRDSPFSAFFTSTGESKKSPRAPRDQVILLSERFSGTSAFAHSLAFCQAVRNRRG